MNKSCKQCGGSFEITDKDQAFYTKMQVPQPNFCPDCRMQRRLTWRNERKLYNRKCDLCGSQIISIYSPDKSVKVYCHKCWWSDKWDPMKYGRDFDFNRPFFEQFKEMMLEVPVISINMHDDNVNCDYTHLSSGNKNCYLIFAASDSEDCFYTTYIQRCKDVSDCFFIFDSELCYECIDSYNCYNLQHSQICQNCRDSYFLYDCKGCSNCFGCVSLKNKEYYIFNKPYSKEEYFKKVQELLKDRASFEAAREKFYALKKSIPHKYYAGISNENVTGDHVFFSKNSEECYDSTYLEDCKWCVWFHRAKDCYDCYAWGLPAELGYENQLCGNGFYNVKFSAYCGNNIKNLTHCYYCFAGSGDLFGCIGLRRKQYCIFNKQYSKEEYEKLSARIIEHMKETGEWGQFFPAQLSPFAYNETVANEYYPLSKEQILQKGFKWKDEESITKYQGAKIVIPEKISNVDESFANKILTCECCGKNYKLVSQELKLYKKMNIPVPLKCFNCRYKARFDLRNPRKLWTRNCAKCGAEIKTTYSPDRPEVVYCEKCYEKEVY
ncbi:MAG: zinc-ribbon domain containing protein [Candidatus Gracilibacteria bacterium]|jgi:hypothetical protein